MKRARWKKQVLKSLGMLSPQQAKKIKVAKRLISKYPNVAPDNLLLKDVYEMTFEEFRSAFSKEALRLNNYRSVNETISFLKSTYIDIIATAVKEEKENVNIEGLRTIAFRLDYMDAVRRYCRRRNLSL